MEELKNPGSSELPGRAKVDAADEKISHAALIKEVGAPTAGAVVRDKNRANRSWIPHFGKLLAGDVILTRCAQNAFHENSSEKLIPENSFFRAVKFVVPSRTRIQGTVMNQSSVGFSAEESSWHHASLYLGDGLILEATLGISSLYRVGSVKRVPLVTDGLKNELLVCRHVEIQEDPTLGQQVAWWGAKTYLSDDTSYDVARAISAARPPGGNPNMPSNKRKRAYICSEFILECMFHGAQLMKDEFDQLDGRNPDTILYPAAFAKNATKFVQKELPTREHYHKQNDFG